MTISVNNSDFSLKTTIYENGKLINQLSIQFQLDHRIKRYLTTALNYIFLRLHFKNIFLLLACKTMDMHFLQGCKKEEFRFASCGWKIMMIVKNIGDGGLNQPCMIFLQS